ncbi:MAG: hypothetical protein J5680_04595 [Neisseriaceae bacterium]|nr:hypothetical protein [Neisseriaceae bacterium]
MNDKVEIIKRGIIRAEEFEEFDRPLMGLVLLEIGFISFILGGTSVLLFFDLVLGYSHFGFTQVIYSLLATFLFFCLFAILLQNDIAKMVLIILLSVGWTTAILYGAKNLEIDLAGLIGVGIISFPILYFVHSVGISALDEY